MPDKPDSVALAMTGASGAQYGLRLLQCLLEGDHHVYLMLSQPAQVVIGMETDLKLGNRPAEIQRALLERYGGQAEQLEVLGESQWTAPVASGSGAPRAMAVCPCTTGTLAAVANGLCRDLMERAADVALKEQRRLVLVPRETPFSALHLENMARLAHMGAVILPANPGFYHQPSTIDDLVDFVVARVLDHLDVAHQLMPRWGLES